MNTKQTSSQGSERNEQTTTRNEQTTTRRINLTELSIICGGVYFLIRFLIS